MALFHKCDDECRQYKDKDHPLKDRWVIDGVKYRRCPLTTINVKVYEFIRAHNLLEKGILMNKGGWLDQSNKVIEVLSFISMKLREHNEEK